MHSCTQLSQMIEAELQAVEHKFDRASQASDQVKRSLVSAHENSLLQEDKSKAEIKRLGSQIMDAVQEYEADQPLETAYRKIKDIFR